MKHGEKGQKAMETMSHEIMRDVMGEMQSQEKNANVIEQRFLEHSRKEYLAWGCDKTCTDYNTEKLNRLSDMPMCSCPAVITVKGDTSIFMH
jgi:hypothetical protein